MEDIEEKNYPGFSQDWRLRWLASISELSDIELQREKWLDKGNTNPHWSYVEFMCCYFDDLAVKGDLEEDYSRTIRDKLVSPAEYAVLKNWHNRLSKYKEPKGSNSNHELILLDEEWVQIASMGKKALETLFPLLNEKEKLQIQGFPKTGVKRGK